jgi:Zn-dependent protease with chaperone function
VTPGTEVAVTERGEFWKKIRGQGQRCLILGLAALRGMEQGQFKAILAHEYGHFSNRDSAGGNLARQVQASIHHMAYRLAVSGQARWYNPAWLFVNIFSRIFLRITLGASRLQEILADRYAVIAFGVQNLVNGLRYLVHQDLVFAAQVGSEIQEARSQNRALSNLYSLPQIQVEEQLKSLEEKEREILNRSTSPYDSHPAIRDRFELLKPLENVIFSSEEKNPVWELLLKPEELQVDMTELVQNNLHQNRG